MLISAFNLETAIYRGLHKECPYQAAKEKRWGGCTGGGQRIGTK